MDYVSHCRSNDPAGTKYLRFIATPNAQRRGYEVRRAVYPLVSSQVDRSKLVHWSVRAGDGGNTPGYRRFERLSSGAEREIESEDRLFSLPEGFARAAWRTLTDIWFVGEYYSPAIEPAMTEYGRGGVKLPAPVEVGQHRVFVRSDAGTLFPRLSANTMGLYLRSIPASERESWPQSAESRLVEDHLGKYLLPLLPARVTGLNFYYDGADIGDDRLSYDGSQLPPLPDRAAVVAYIKSLDSWKELSRQLGTNAKMITGLLIGGEGK